MMLAMPPWPRWPWLPLAAALLVATLAAGDTTGGEPSAAESRGPVPIFILSVETPVETAGSTAAPAVDVALEIDDRGRPVEVLVKRIQPATRFDDMFSAVTMETLLRWRYAPALEAGKPVPATLNLTIQFPALGETPAAGAGRSLIENRDEAMSFRQRTLSLPTDQRIELLLQKVNAGLKFMEKPAVQIAESPRFRVMSDLPDPKAGKSIANNLEVAFNFVETLLGGHVPAQPGHDRVVALVFSRRHRFESMRASIEGIEASIAGYYNPVGMLAFAAQMQTNEQLIEVMLHEGVHAYMDRHVARPGVVFPRWLDEGLAEYVGNSRTDGDGRLQPGKVRKKQTLRNPIGSFRIKSDAGFSLEALKAAVKKGQAIPLAELVAASRDEFYGERREMFYEMAWILIHFLRHGGPGWAEERFPRLVLYIGEGFRPVDVFHAFYGDPRTLEPAFHQYIRRF